MLLVGVVSFYAANLVAVLLAVAVLLVHHKANPVFVGGTALIACLAVAIPAAALWLRRRGAGRLPQWVTRIRGFADAVEAVGDVPRGHLRDRPLLAETTGAQLAIIELDALTLWLVFFAIGQPVELWIAYASFIMASVAASIGIAPLGLGTFEAGSVATLGVLGVPVEDALTATLLLRGLTFWLPMLPGLWLARRELGPGRGRWTDEPTSG